MPTGKRTNRPGNVLFISLFMALSVALSDAVEPVLLIVPTLWQLMANNIIRAESPWSLGGIVEFDGSSNSLATLLWMSSAVMAACRNLPLGNDHGCFRCA